MEKVAKKVGMEHFKTKINVNNMKPHNTELNCCHK